MKIECLVAVLLRMDQRLTVKIADWYDENGPEHFDLVPDQMVKIDNCLILGANESYVKQLLKSPDRPFQ